MFHGHSGSSSDQAIGLAQSTRAEPRPYPAMSMQLFLLTCLLPKVLAAFTQHSLGSDVCSNEVSLNLLQKRRVGLADRSGSINRTRDAGSRSKVVFIKTHFTGSSTATGIFQRYCDQHHVNCAQKPPHSHDGGTVKREELSEYVRSHVGESVDIWPWHVDYDRESFALLIPGAVTVSILREPLSRVISGFLHGVVPISRVRDIVRSLQTNGQVPSCGHTSLCKSSPMSVQIPRLSDLDLVMLTEDYDRSLVLLARKLKWPLQDVLYTRMRVSEPDDGKQELLDEFKAYMSQPLENMTQTGKAYVEKCIQKDKDMYSQAKEMFQKQLDVLSPEDYAQVEKDVARLQSANQVLQDCCMKEPSDPYCVSMEETAMDWHKRTDKGLPPAGVEDALCRHRAFSALG